MPGQYRPTGPSAGIGNPLPGGPRARHAALVVPAPSTSRSVLPPEEEAGVAPVTGDGAVTAEQATASASGSLTITGTAAVSAASATVSASGAESFTATGAVTAEQATVSASGTAGSAPVTGTGAVTAEQATVAATGAESFTGTAALTASQATAEASGALTITGTGAVTASEAVVAASGTQLQDVTGTATVTARQAVVDALGIGGIATGGMGGRFGSTDQRRVLPYAPITPRISGIGAATARSAVVTATGTVNDDDLVFLLAA